MNWPGFGLIPFTTLFAAKKFGLSKVTLYLKLPAALSRVADPISTSAGEFVLVFTSPSKGPESFGKT